MKNTLIVNLYAGPGTGKSTAAAYIFSQLKMKGIDAELVTEYAKDKTWEGCNEAFKCNLYINAKQIYRISRVYGKLDVIVTDSPILLGAVYANNEEHVINASIAEDKKYNNRLDIFLKRNEDIAYNQNGRNQDENGAKELDKCIFNLLEKECSNYFTIKASSEGYDQIVKMVLTKLKENE